MKTPQVAELSPLPVTHQAVIPESYLDHLGHMNVAWYTHLYGTATRRFYELFDMGRAQQLEHDAGVVALESHIRYLAEVRLGEHITVRTRAIARTEKRIHFLQFMVLDEEKRLASTCEFVAAYMDMTARRMAPLPEPVAAGFDRIVAEHARLKWEPPLCGAMGP